MTAWILCWHRCHCCWTPSWDGWTYCWGWCQTFRFLWNCPAALMKYPDRHKPVNTKTCKPVYPSEFASQSHHQYFFVILPSFLIEQSRIETGNMKIGPQVGIQTWAGCDTTGAYAGSLPTRIRLWPVSQMLVVMIYPLSQNTIWVFSQNVAFGVCIELCNCFSKLHTFWDNSLCKERAGNAAALEKILKVINQCQAVLFHFSVAEDTVSGFNGKYHVIPDCMWRMSAFKKDRLIAFLLPAMWQNNKTAADISPTNQ